MIFTEQGLTSQGELLLYNIIFTDDEKNNLTQCIELHYF